MSEYTLQLLSLLGLSYSSHHNTRIQKACTYRKWIAYLHRSFLYFYSHIEINVKMYIESKNSIRAIEVSSRSTRAIKMPAVVKNVVPDEASTLVGIESDDQLCQTFQ